MKFGSVCSGIEAASIAFESVDVKPAWFSEIEDFPSSVLDFHYPNIKNYGDMNNLPKLILDEKIEAPDILCGGTPCQAFSLAGLQAGLSDERGQLTLKFIEIANSIDYVRTKKGLNKSLIMWENVEGVLSDKTNAFGIFIAGLAGLNKPIIVNKWTSSGVLYGLTRNIAWRVLDSKYFGVPQQRKRLYVIATDTNIKPELVLFEKCKKDNYFELINLNNIYTDKESSSDTLFETKSDYTKEINGEKIEIFRLYSDCLYSAYGTKWNGNAAAYNGSLYISQNDRIRRLSPLECERLMGFPDNYTNILNAKDTSRYKAIGNSWNIQTIEWIVSRIKNVKNLEDNSWLENIDIEKVSDGYKLFMFKNNIIKITEDLMINCSLSSNNIKKSSFFDIVDTNPPEKLYISSRASSGILRRKIEKNIKMNKRLEFLFEKQVKQLEESKFVKTIKRIENKSITKITRVSDSQIIDKTNFMYNK